MHYTRTGGNKPPLILLHGLTGDGATWTPVAHALEGAYDVIMPDARGHGKSSVPNDGYLYEDHANDVIGLIEALGLISPILIGHSMGGMTAALVAFCKPRLLRGLVLADPTFLSPERQREVYESDAVEQHRRLRNKSLEEILTEAQARHPHRSMDTLKLVLQARHKTDMKAWQVLTPPNPDYRQLLNPIDIPILLVIADQGIVSPAMAEELQNLNPKLHVQKITEAGHGLHYDQPEQFIDIVRSFLRAFSR